MIRLSRFPKRWRLPLAGGLLVAVLAGAALLAAHWVPSRVQGPADTNRAPVVAAPAPAAAPTPPGHVPGPEAGCVVERSGPLAFRGSDTRDVVRVSILGRTCAEATLHIVLASAEGAELYRFEVALRSALAARASEAELLQAAEVFAQEAFDNAGIAGSTAELPSWSDALTYYAGHPEALKIKRPAYEALRRQHRPVFWHATGPESWRSVVYDPATGTARIIVAVGP